MSYRTFHIPTAKFMDRVDISAIMGYTDGMIPAPFDAIVAEMTKEAADLIQAKAEVRILDNAQFDQCKLYIGDETLELERIIHAMVRASEQIAFFICTIGPEVPAKIKELSAGGLQLEAYSLDLIASEAVDMAMDVVQEALDEELKVHGLHLTNRYSPGYCDWNISEQQKLFRILPGEFTKISLADTSVMHPIKTISGIIGIGKNVRFNPYTCEVCRRKDCGYSKRNKKTAA